MIASLKQKETWKRYLASLKFALYCITHPFDGFWDLTHEKRGTYAAANTILILTLIALTAVLIAAFAVRSTEMRYAWQVAIGTGIFIYLVLEIFGVFTLDIPVSIPDLVIGVIAAALVGSVLQLFFFDLDYRSTEKLRFEDDEYYYYVTAVPKRKQERSVDEWTQ